MHGHRRTALAATLILAAGALACGPAAAQDDQPAAGTDAGAAADTNGVSPARNGTVGETEADETELQTGGMVAGGVDNQRSVDLEARQDAETTVAGAAKVAQTMRADGDLAKLLGRAKAVFIVPDYGKGALLVGGAAGEGVLVMNGAGGWGAPAFYSIGEVSIGAEAGASGGAIAMLLMSDKAVASFMQDNNFSLNANADLTVLTWSANAQGSWGKGDVVMWADTKGVFGGVGLSASDIAFDEEETRAFYGRAVDPLDVLRGKAPSHVEGARALETALGG